MYCCTYIRRIVLCHTNEHLTLTLTLTRERVTNDTPGSLTSDRVLMVTSDKRGAAVCTAREDWFNTAYLLQVGFRPDPLFHTEPSPS